MIDTLGHGLPSKEDNAWVLVGRLLEDFFRRYNHGRLLLLVLLVR